MAKFAKVESLDALKELRTCLCNLASKITVSIDEADYDVQNTLNWLKHDQYPYWKSQLTKRKEELFKAKLELKRKQYIDNSPAGGAYSHIDQKKAMAFAQRRLEQAEDKLKKIQKWIPKLEKQMYECRTALQGLANLVRIDLPKKRTQIDQMIYSLESYMDVKAPEIQIPSAMGSLDSHDDMSKPVEQKQEQSSESVLDIYRRLCDRNPVSSLTNEIRIKESKIKLFDIEDGDQAFDVLCKYKVSEKEIRDNVTIIIEDSVSTSNFIFIEKIAVDKDKHTHIYIAPVESNDSMGYSALAISNFLRWNPTWLDVFLLPVDWMILFKNGWVLNIFDADGTMLYQMRDDSF